MLACRCYMPRTQPKGLYSTLPSVLLRRSPCFVILVRALIAVEVLPSQ